MAVETYTSSIHMTQVKATETVIDGSGRLQSKARWSGPGIKTAFGMLAGVAAGIFLL